MFVSSYNTFIQTNTSQSNQRERVEKSKPSNNTFASKLLQNEVLESKNTKNIPISYISNYKAFSNKQKLEDTFEDINKEKYTQINSINSAKVAYADNSKIFSLFLEPKATQHQTPQIDDKLSSNLQELQKTNMRHKMVNTYIANDKYYQITA